MILTYLADSYFFFALSVFFLVYFLSFIYLYKTKGIHQVTAQGGSIIFNPLGFASIPAVLSYFWISGAFGSIGKKSTTLPSFDSATPVDPADVPGILKPGTS